MIDVSTKRILAHPDITIAVDVMGADNGVEVFLSGIALALKNSVGDIGNLVLVGDEVRVKQLLYAHRASKLLKKIEIVHAEQEIEMTDKPMFALRNKKSSSMFQAIEMVKDRRADGMLSCGNTSCLMAAGTLKLRTMPGIDRPALCAMIPGPHHTFALIDVGANPSSTAKNLVHNAVLGAHYFKTVADVENPRVGLLTIGTEEGKGSDLICEAHRLLKLAMDVNYFGLIEGFQLFEDKVDVVVCDGFVGNILLKSIESLAKTLKNCIRREIFKNPLRILGAILARGALNSIKQRLSPDKFNGAPFLGLNGTIIKSHGSSTAEGIASALLLACKTARALRCKELNEIIEKVNVAVC